MAGSRGGKRCPPLWSRRYERAVTRQSSAAMRPSPAGVTGTNGGRTTIMASSWPAAPTGQAIYIDPKAEMVIARFAPHPLAGNVNPDPTSLPAYRAIAEHLMKKR